MLRIIICFGKNDHSLMGSTNLADLGFRRRSADEDLEWVLMVPNAARVASCFDAANSALAKYFDFPLAGVHPSAHGRLDLPWKLEMCIGQTALVEVMDGDRLLYRQIWLEKYADLFIFPQQTGAED